MSRVPEQTPVHAYAAWAPGVTTPEAWREWAADTRTIGMSADSPALAYTDPLFRRRLSQLSRMTIEVIHECIAVDADAASCKIVFLSFRGEVTCQLKINHTLITEHAVMPALFSLSVFNAPPALASIALGLTAGYTSLAPVGEHAFRTGVQAAVASARASDAGVLLVYADELVPEAYASRCAGTPACVPLAFAAHLAHTDDDAPCMPFTAAETACPAAFLRRLIKETH